jgi:NAD(P)-dependent dehydrogenase (short-subunit alcohol dehydrogenase family)
VATFGGAGLDTKVALVTGAASGIGRATALRFAHGGAKVVVADIDAALGQAVADEIAAAGGEALAVATDVADAAQVQALLAATVDRFGGLDLAVNNAGIMGGNAPVEEMDEAVWRRGIDVMLTGVFLCMKAEIPLLLARDGGAIVNTSSGAGLVGFPDQSNYVAAKHGVVGLTKAAALENVTRGIRINAVCPGTARSRMVDEWIQGDPDKEAMVAGLHPIGRIADADEIAAAIVWLCSDEASFVVGHALPVDGGYTAQ